MATMAPHRAATLLLAEAEAHDHECVEIIEDATRRLQAVAHELAHIGRRMNEAKRSSRLSIEKARRARNVAAGEDVRSGFAMPGQLVVEALAGDSDDSDDLSARLRGGFGREYGAAA